MDNSLDDDAGLNRRAMGQGACRRAIRALGLVALGLLAGACNRDTTVISGPPEARREPPAGSAPSTSATGSAPRAPAVGASGSGGAGPASAAAVAASPGASAGGSSSGGAAPALSASGGSAYRHAAPGRLIAIGDLHGDVAATRAALRLGGAIDASDRWIGKNLTVVQTGDQLDRGDDERDILDLFERLEAAARQGGGQVIALNGNHEIMNVQGDYRYVTPEGMSEFAGVTPRSSEARAAPPAFQVRAAAFLPGGAYAEVLSKRDMIAVVGDSVFVHGGVLPAHVRYGIDRINSEMRDWMSGTDARAPETVAGETAPVWVRDYSLDPVSERTCEVLGQVLAALKVSRMVVGHTVQKHGISSACDDRVYRIDVGLSSYYGDGPIQVLEVDAGKVRTLSAPREAR